ncbi:MAG: hypothetical protein WCI73_02680 [Phycisphaerae bacterium]
MTPMHTWKWLPTRFTRLLSQGSASASDRPGRPCLAALEQLDDRVLLSVAPTANADQIAALIGLLRTELSLNSSEVAVLKLATGAVTVGQKTDADSAFLKLESDFLKIDGLLLNFAASTVDGEAKDKDHKVQVVSAQMQDVFLKIDALLPTLDKGSQELLVPAVQKVREAALTALNAITDLGALKITDHKMGNAFLKIDAELLKIDGFTIKLSADAIAGKVMPQDKWLPTALNNMFLKIDSQIGAMGDGSVYKELVGAVDQLKIDTQGFLAGLTTPVGTTTTAVTSFTGGVKLGPTGDKIG